MKKLGHRKVMVKVTPVSGTVKWSSPGVWFSLLTHAAERIRQPAEVCKAARLRVRSGGGMATEDCWNIAK